MNEPSAGYIPALNRHWLTPVYDPIIRFAMREKFIKQRLIEVANLRPAEHVLDIGCGTGTLDIMLQRSQSSACVTGLDGDDKILEIASHKATEAGLPGIRWDKGLSYDLPYPDSSFDLVLSSLMIHHLSAPNKLRTFQEVRRVLKPGGRFTILDLGKSPKGPAKWIAGLLGRMERAGDNIKGLIPPFLWEAGFEQVEEVERLPAFFGLLVIYRAKRRT